MERFESANVSIGITGEFEIAIQLTGGSATMSFDRSSTPEDVAHRLCLLAHMLERDARLRLKD